MRIVRQRSPERFTVVDNDVLEDERISFRARGVLGFLLSRPDGWETSSERLAATSPHEGRDAIRTALRELESVGYLARKRLQDAANGRWSTVTAIVDRPTPENPSSGPRRLENRPSGDRTSAGQASLPITDSNNGHKALEVEVDPQPPARTPGAPGREEISIPADVLTVVGDLAELAAELRIRRADAGLTTSRWTARAVRRAIAAAVTAGYPAEHLTAALTSTALDPATKVPGRLAHDGPWWDTAELAARHAERAAHLEERHRAERAAAAVAEVEEARRRSTCWRCKGTGRTTFKAGDRDINVPCTHGVDTNQETA